MTTTRKIDGESLGSSSKAATRFRNMQAIISAAEEVFSTKGFGGATTQAIADRAGLPKANVHYYFPTKKALYTRVLEDILEDWIDDAKIFDISDDPETVFRAYIRRKMEHSFNRPYASKVWAMEIICRGRVFDEVLKRPFLSWHRKKIGQIRRWVSQGKLAPANPHYTMYSIWAMTQHYADFEYQIRAVNNGEPLSVAQREEATRSVIDQLLLGIIPRREARE